MKNGEKHKSDAAHGQTERGGISEIFIRRPITTTLLMTGIVLFGLIGYRALPVSDLPTVDYPTISVNASLPGANPETMAASVATPLERQFSGIAGIDSINSTNSQGSTSITLQFNLSRNIDAAAQDVQTAISAALQQLPPGMPSPPSLRKVNPADSPILFLSLNSQVLPLSAVDEYAETLVAQRISMVDGVSQVQVYGAQKYAVRVQIDPGRLATYGIGIDQVNAAITNGNPNTAVGTLYGKTTNLTLDTNGQLQNAAGFRHTHRSPAATARLNSKRRKESGCPTDSTCACWAGSACPVAVAARLLRLRSEHPGPQRRCCD